VQGCQLLCLDQRELIDEVDEVLEASVEMGLSAQQHDVLEVGVVDVSIHSEKTFEDYFDDCFEVARERNAECTREDLFVVELILYPCHEEVDILAC